MCLPPRKWIFVSGKAIYKPLGFRVIPHLHCRPHRCFLCSYNFCNSSCRRSLVCSSHPVHSRRGPFCFILKWDIRDWTSWSTYCEVNKQFSYLCCPCALGLGAWPAQFQGFFWADAPVFWADATGRQPHNWSVLSGSVLTSSLPLQRQIQEFWKGGRNPLPMWTSKVREKWKVFFAPKVSKKWKSECQINVFLAFGTKIQGFIIIWSNLLMKNT